nr:ADP,ATP carrier protein, mitochondrial [Ipomoea batatas]
MADIHVSTTLLSKASAYGLYNAGLKSCKASQDCHDSTAKLQLVFVQAPAEKGFFKLCYLTLMGGVFCWPVSKTAGPPFERCIELCFQGLTSRGLFNFKKDRVATGNGFAGTLPWVVLLDSFFASLLLDGSIKMVAGLASYPIGYSS